jgi:hypothetical protein
MSVVVRKLVVDRSIGCGNLRGDREMISAEIVEREEEKAGREKMMTEGHNWEGSREIHGWRS